MNGAVTHLGLIQIHYSQSVGLLLAPRTLDVIDDDAGEVLVLLAEESLAMENACQSVLSVSMHCVCCSRINPSLVVKSMLLVTYSISLGSE